MKFQQSKNDPINRDNEGRFELKKAIIEIWLGRWFLVQTSSEDDYEIERNIREIESLLLDPELSVPFDGNDI